MTRIMNWCFQTSCISDTADSLPQDRGSVIPGFCLCHICGYTQGTVCASYLFPAHILFGFVKVVALISVVVRYFDCSNSDKKVHGTRALDVTLPTIEPGLPMSLFFSSCCTICSGPMVFAR